MELGLATLSWYNILLLFSIYSVILALIARAAKLGHVLGVVYGVSLLASYFTRDLAVGIVYMVGPTVCVLIGFVGLVLANFIVDFSVK